VIVVCCRRSLLSGCLGTPAMPVRTRQARPRCTRDCNRWSASTEKTDLKVMLKPRKKATRCTQHAPQVCHQLRKRVPGFAQRWSARRAQSCAKMWLSLTQALPEAIAAGQRKRAAGHLFPSCFAASARYNSHHESHQRAGTHHKSPQHVLKQNRECSAAARAQEAIGTIQPTTANDALLTPLRITPDPTMPNESAGEFAMRTSRQFGLMQTIIQRLLAAHEANRRTPSHDPLPSDRCPVPRWAARANQPPVTPIFRFPWAAELRLLPSCRSTASIR